MLIIRELTHDDDFWMVGQVYVESWRGAYRGMVPQSYLDKLTPERWSGSQSADPSASLGMFLDGQIIGTSHTCFARDPLREGYGEIVSLYLRPAHMGKGNGRLLLEAAMRKLYNEGCTDVCLWAISQNQRAGGFYRHMGFALSGQTQIESVGGANLLLAEYCRSLSGIEETA